MVGVVGCELSLPICETLFGALKRPHQVLPPVCLGCANLLLYYFSFIHECCISLSCLQKVTFHILQNDVVDIEYWPCKSVDRAACRYHFTSIWVSYLILILSSAPRPDLLLFPARLHNPNLQDLHLARLQIQQHHLPRLLEPRYTD